MTKLTATNFSSELLQQLSGEEILQLLMSIDETVLGDPTSTSSNTIGSNMHAKLNWLLTSLAGINTNTETANLGAATSTANNATSAVAHAKLNWLLNTLGTVNTNTATANLGAPATAASNATSAVAHAKLNWLLSTIQTISTNTSSGSGSGLAGTVMTVGTANFSSNNMQPLAQVDLYAQDLSTLLATVSGKGRLHFIGNNTGYGISLNIDGKYSVRIPTNGSTVFTNLENIPFSSYVRISVGGTAALNAIKLVYEAV